MEIYWVLFYERPQVLADLDSLQKKRYGVHIAKPKEPEQPRIEYGVPIQTDLEEIDKEMRQPPSRSR